MLRLKRSPATARAACNTQRVVRATRERRECRLYRGAIIAREHNRPVVDSMGDRGKHPLDRLIPDGTDNHAAVLSV